MELLEEDHPEEEVVMDGVEVVEIHLQVVHMELHQKEEVEVAEGVAVVQEEEVVGIEEAVEEEGTIDLLEMVEDLVHMAVVQEEVALVDIKEEEEEKEEMVVVVAGMLSHNWVEFHFQMIF